MRAQAAKEVTSESLEILGSFCREDYLPCCESIFQRIRRYSRLTVHSPRSRALLRVLLLASVRRSMLMAHTLPYVMYVIEIIPQHGGEQGHGAEVENGT